MFGRFKISLSFALTALAVSASAFIPLRDGNVISREDAKTQSTAYFFDGMNRIDRIVYPDASEASFEYDPNGNIVTQASPLASSSFSYDSMNRLSSSLISVDSRSFAVTNSYDLNGKGVSERQRCQCVNLCIFYAAVLTQPKTAMRLCLEKPAEGG